MSNLIEYLSQTQRLDSLRPFQIQLINDCLVEATSDTRYVSN
jgi:hypothetical protein